MFVRFYIFLSLFSFRYIKNTNVCLSFSKFLNELFRVFLVQNTFTVFQFENNEQERINQAMLQQRLLEVNVVLRRYLIRPGSITVELLI